MEGIEGKTFNDGYDIAVYQTDYGLSKASYMELLNMVSDDNVLPLDLEASDTEVFAIGFISTEAAETLDYDYDGLQTYLSESWMIFQRKMITANTHITGCLYIWVMNASVTLKTTGK